MARLLGKPILPLRLGGSSEVNPLIGDIQVEPFDQPPEAILALIDRLLGPVGPESVEIDPDVPPYPGLEPLSEKHAPLLFGRGEHIDRAIREFDRNSPARLVIVSGPSGSGKSSLVRAGIVPRLRSQGWNISGPHQPRQIAVDEPPPLPTAAGPSLLVIDQAEELADLDAEAESVQRAWLTAAISEGTWVLLTVRSEFRDEVGRALPRAIDHYVPHPDIDDLFDIVRGPAKVANLGVSETLVNRLVTQTGSGQALPLLALTLHELWKQRDTSADALLDATLDQLGGVQGVMAGLAQEALQGAAEGDPQTVELVLAVLTRLATPNRQPPTRSPIRVETLNTTQRRWLNRFVAVGLVAYRTTYALGARLDVDVRPTGRDLADVTHEALFGWPPLAEAIDEQRQRNAMLNSIERSAEQWRAGGDTDRTLLLAGDRLEFARAEGLGQRSGATDSDTLLDDFIGASLRNDRDRRVRRWSVFGIAAALAVAIVAAGVALAQARQADARRTDAEVARADADAARQDADSARLRAEASETEARSIRVAAEATALIDDERDRALLTAVAAHRLGANTDTERALLAALNEPAGPLRYYTSELLDWTSLRFLDGDSGLVLDHNGALSTVDLTTGSHSPVPLSGEPAGGGLTEVRRVPNSLLVVFKGRSTSGASLAGVHDFGTGTTWSTTARSEIRSVDASKDWLTFGDFEGRVLTARIHQDGTVGPTQEVDLHDSDITSVTMSRDGRHLAVASRTSVRFHERLDQGWGPAVELHRANLGAPTALHLAFRRDLEPGRPNMLYGSGTDPTIRQWTLDRSSAEGTIIGSHIGGVEALAVDPEAPLLLSAGRGGQIQRWDLEHSTALGSSLRAHRQEVSGLSVDPDPGANRLISTSANRAILWDLAPERVVERAGVLPEGWEELTVVGLIDGDGPLAVVTSDGSVLVDDGRSFSFPAGVERGWWVADQLAVSRRDANRPTDGLEVWLLGDQPATPTVSGASAVDTGHCLLAAAHDNTVSIADVGGCGLSPMEINVTGGGDEWFIAGLALSDGEDKLAVAGSDGGIAIYDLAGHSQIQELTSGEPGIPTVLHWMGSTRLVVGHDRGGATEMFDLTGGPSLTVDVHDDAVRFVDADEETDRLVLGSEDGTISLVSVSDRLRVVGLLSARRAVQENDPEATVRGLRLIGGSSALVSVQSGTVTSWELEPEQLVAEACRRAGRTLTNGELAELGLGPSTSLC